MTLSRFAAPATALLLALAACGGDSGNVLVVYSPHGRDMLEVFEQRFEASHPGVDVQWIDMGSQEVLDRLRSERANPQADVWFGAPAAMFQRAAADSLLQRMAPAWASAVPADARDANGYWYGTYETPEVIAYNSVAVSAQDAPKDWEDVLDPKWRDRVLIRDPLASGTMRTIFGMILERSIRQTGDTAAGFAWLRRLDAQTKEYVLNPTLLYQKLARQEGLITLWDMPDIEIIRSKQNLPIGYVYPSSGTPMVIDAIAIPRGAPHPELAREFVDFVGGEAGVLLAAREFYRLPARQDIPDDSLPANLRDARRAIVKEPMDWQLLERRLPDWMRDWDEHIRGRS